MNVKSTKLFQNLDSGLNESERDMVIEDLMSLQNEMKPLGIVKDKNDLLVLKDKSLLMVLIWQHELFAIKFFHQISKKPPKIKNNIPVIEKDNFFVKIFKLLYNKLKF